MNLVQFMVDGEMKNDMAISEENKDILRITSPVGGGEYCFGDEQYITWEATSDISTVTLGIESSGSHFIINQGLHPGVKQENGNYIGEYKWKTGIARVLPEDILVGKPAYLYIKGNTGPDGKGIQNVYQDKPIIIRKCTAKLVSEESEDGYYTELTLFKDENKIHIYRRTLDYDSEFNTTYKYKIEGQKIYFKLIEDKIEYPGEEYYDVQDGVILKSEIKKRKDNIFFKPESRIKELEGQINWHEQNHQYKIIFFLFHKHPELMSKDDFRTFLRLKIEKIENILTEVKKIMKGYESLNEKEQEEIVTKLEKFYSENEVSGSEVYNKDELIQEAKKYLNHGF